MSSSSSSSSSSSEDEQPKQVKEESPKKEKNTKVNCFRTNSRRKIDNNGIFQKRKAEVEEEPAKVGKPSSKKQKEEVTGRLKDQEGNEVIIDLKNEK